MPHLFSALTLRNLTLRNRVMLSPMCMYSAGDDGVLTHWHHTHYLSRAVGGTGLLMMEATAVEARGRISRRDLGLWDDEQIAPLAQLADDVHAAGGALGVQLAHAGRKAWSDTRGDGPERAVAPTNRPFDAEWAAPHALTAEEIPAVVAAWRGAANRAAAAGLDVVEIHGAHGYLVHEFLSPLTNRRDDAYGGAMPRRLRFLLEIVDAVREVWPAEKPLFVRLSATDWVTGGLTVDDTVGIAAALREHDVDVVDCSTGGIVPHGRPAATEPGYQIPFAGRVRQDADVATVAVGGITTPQLANATIRNGSADLVALGRELLRSPYWVLHAAHALGHDVDWPTPYRRAKI
jgi:2,4-dienoyl-CoA reductase-like NADH-dependent reductase (Old Yellow Enzyme family)